MTQAQFIENLTGLCDGKDFPKDLLKVYAQYIKGLNCIRTPACKKRNFVQVIRIT